MQVEEGSVWVETVAKSMVWQIKLLNEGIWFQASFGRSLYFIKEMIMVLLCLLFMLMT